MIIQKQHGNAFKKTDLQYKLQILNIDEVLGCGLVSQGCVRATCIGAKEAGFKVNLLKNGHST